MGDSVIDILLKDKLSGVNEWARRTFPVGANYSIANDVAFLFRPTMNALVTPTIKEMLAKSGVADADIPLWANEMVDAMEEEVDNKGEITLFGSIVFHKEDIDGLKNLIEKNLPDVERNCYTIKE